MPIGTHVQTNFTAGELSPRLLGRSDLAKYNNGVSVLQNMLVQQHGGASRRPGTRYVADTKRSGVAQPGLLCGSAGSSSTAAESIGEVRLIPFEYSTEQTYVLEFGLNYIRFYKDAAQIQSGGSPVELATPYGEDEIKDLKFTQSADVLYICHPDHQQRQVNRTSDTAWTMTLFEFDDGPYESTNTDTADTLTLSTVTLGTATLTATGHTPFLATDVATATNTGRLFRFQSGGDKWGWGEITGFTSTSIVTVDLVVAPDAATATDTWRLGSWSPTLGYPWSPAFHQERLWFGGRNDAPQTFWGSVVNNFTRFQPSDVVDGVVGDDDALNFTISDNRVNAIYWLASTAKGLLIGTSGGEFVVESSDVTKPITSTNVGVFRQSSHGSRRVPRQTQVGNAILFTQSSGRKLREMIYQFERDQHVSADMTLLAEHITADRLLDVDYQQEPSSIVWAIDEVGNLLSLTYEREQDVIAWAKHPIGGTFLHENGDTHAMVESIAVISEDKEDRLWMIVKRTIDGETERYVEFLEDQFQTNDSLLTDAFFLDSGLTYSGWNTNACHLLRLIGAVAGSSSSIFEEDDTGTMDAFGFGFTPFSVASVGRVYRFQGTAGPIDVEVTAFVSNIQVTVRFKSAVPLELAGTKTADWALTVSSISNLDHLEGETINFLIDGATHADVVVSSGVATMVQGALGVFGADVHVGLPYVSSIESLPVVPTTMGFESKGKHKAPYKASIILHDTVGLLAGYRLEDGRELIDPIAFREGGAVLGQYVPLFTGTKQITLEGSYASEAKVIMRQEQPLPVTVLSVIYELDVNEV